MNPNLSSHRQNDLIQATLEQIERSSSQLALTSQSHEEKLASLRHRIELQKQEAKRAAIVKQDELENAWQQGSFQAQEAFKTETDLTRTELQDEVAETKKQVKKQLSDGEYDWFLSKQRLAKEVESDKEAAKDNYKKEKGKLKHHGADFTSLSNECLAVLGRHKCELKVHGGDLLDPPDDSNHFAAHQKTVTQIHQLIRQFRKTFWVRFQEERWYLIALLLGMVVLPFPIYLLQNKLLIAGIAAASVSFLVSIITYFVSRRFATLAASQFQDTFGSALATGKQQLLAAQQQNKMRLERKIEKRDNHYKTQLKKIDDQWRLKQQELKEYLAKRQNELQSLANKRGAILQQQLTEKEESLREKYQPNIEANQHKLDTTHAKLQTEFDQESENLAHAADARRSELRTEWLESIQQLQAETEQMKAVSSIAETDLHTPFSDWEPAKAPPQAIPFGDIKIDLAKLPQSLPADPAFALDQHELALPTALDLVHAPSLVIETASEKSRATELLRLIMVRMLTSIPPGKLRFTIVDPVGLGQSFSSFMHLADYDEEIIQHRIWTEANHIQSRLADLTQHMENVIQSYLRNEFGTIQEYNVHAGEVAEAFRVLVVANFPSGFTEEAAQRLLSIASSGPRCGVFTLLSLDPSLTMPRNFDLDELRRQANVLILDKDSARWSLEPINHHPISCHDLPSEEQVTRIMHRVGQFAQQASRVEVPFSAVAPQPEDWWSGDSRNEIQVALGRAGATKHQEISLGRGTSQHVLISGKTGSGKSTLLHALITNLSLKYSPDEVQFYLIDFKKGVEFKAYAEHALPHARVIAIESEREFGQSVLQKLDGELRRRGDLFRRVGVQSLAGYRDARPDERMPRILLVIDEFQEFFVKEDKISQEASLLLDRLVRQGRAFGIHVLLGSQTLAGAYTLARATIGQMAVRIALQCSASDASLILSDDNDAARLLRRPGEAIYNDANGMVEGNHPFQVVWLTDIEKESYLRELATRNEATDNPLEPAIVFEGNVAASVAKNPQLQNSWSSPAPDEIPLAPRAWLGEAVAIKEPPAVVFHRRSGSNLMLVGQQDETSLGVMSSAMLSLAAFSPSDADKRSRFIVMDGTRPESPHAGHWHSLRDTTSIDLAIVKPRDAVDALNDLASELERRQNNSVDNSAATFLFIYNLSRFRELQRGEDDFGFGGFGEEKQTSPAEVFATLLREGPNYGLHTIFWSESYTNLMRWIDRPSLRDIESRVLFQMSSTDSSNLMDSSAASQLGQFRAMFYSEDRGRAERFRPYGIPDDDIQLRIRSWKTEREQGTSRQIK